LPALHPRELWLGVSAAESGGSWLIGDRPEREQASNSRENIHSKLLPSSVCFLPGRKTGTFIYKERILFLIQKKKKRPHIFRRWY
jgi:hypothetical protein